MRKLLSLLLVLVIAAGSYASDTQPNSVEKKSGQPGVERDPAPAVSPPLLWNDIITPSVPVETAADRPVEKLSLQDQINRLKRTGQPIPAELQEAIRQQFQPGPRDGEIRERQGGDTIEEAEPIDLNNTYTGTTSGYNDDYDEVCPYEGSTSPDVVYLLTLTEETGVILDLCDSDYDTKIYVYNSELNLVDCNDDYCPGFRSYLFLELVPADDYYIVIDGYGGGFGDYILHVTEFHCDPLECEGTGEVEDNGGCNAAEPAFQEIAVGETICATTSCDGVEWDEDWFVFELADFHELSVTVESYNFDPLLVIVSDPAGDCTGNQLANVNNGLFCMPETYSNILAPGRYYAWVREADTSNELVDAEFAITLNGEVYVPPGGEFCADPIMIEELPYSTAGTTEDNTDSYGSASPDEWYGFSIAESGNVLISMCENTTYDSYLRLLSGDCSTELAYNDDSCGLQSEMLEYLEPGDYVICVEGFSSNSGSFTLDVTHEPFTPGQGDFCSDPWLIEELPYSVSEATTDNIDSYGSESADEWYSVTIEEEGFLTASLCDGTDFDTFVWLLADDCNSVIDSDDYGCGSWGDPSLLVTYLQDPGTYLICVEGSWDEVGSYTLEVDFEPFTPGVGDFCDDPHVVTELPFEIDETNLNNIDTYGMESSDEWFQFEIVEEGLVTISLCDGTTFDSYMTLMGDDCATVLNTDDGSCGDWTSPSYMYMLMNPGTYLICIEGDWGVVGGDYHLSIEWEEFDPDPGEFCATPIEIPMLPFEAVETTANNLDTWGNPSPDEWYQFSVYGDANVTISLCDGGTTFDSYLRLLDEDCGTEITYNDDACGLQSEMIVDLTAGTYVICVEGYSSYSGEYSLDVFSDAPSLGNDCEYPREIESLPFSEEWWTMGYGDTGFDPSPDVYYEFFLEQEGIYTFTTCMEDTYPDYYDTRLLILAEDCESIVFVDDDTCDEGAYDGWSTISTCLQQGLYYLVVEGNDGAAGAYQLDCYYEGPCDGCDPPECPDWGIDEVEPNDGAGGNPPGYDSIAPGETHCGSVWSSSYTRDSDWYQFEVEAGVEADFFLDGEEEHDLALYLFDESGGSPEVLAEGIQQGCADLLISHQFAEAGTYSVYVAYDDFYAAGPSSSYTLEWIDPLDVAEQPVPEQFYLAQNYPNPFNPATTIEFGLPAAAEVTLAIYDITGRQVALLADGVRSAGNHAVQFDAVQMPSGLYFYRLTAGGESFTKKMALVK